MKYTTVIKKILSLALCMVMLLTMVPAIPLSVSAAETSQPATKPATRGTVTGIPTYKISNLEELKAFRDLVNSGSVNADAYLTADIDLGGEDWIPIGRDDQPYAGYFDGRGHTISGLLITGAYGDGSTVKSGFTPGFFGMIKGAGIRNLKISGKNDATTAISLTSNWFIGKGLLVGSMEDSVVYGCIAEGEVGGSGVIAGGLVGVARHSIIIDCGSSATVNCTDTYTGGLVGYMTAGYDVPLCLLNSYCTGNVTNTATGSGYYVGGLVGWLSDDAVNNVFTGTVTAGAEATAGALFGYVDNAILANSVNDETNVTFTPVIERNYYLNGDIAVGGAVSDLDTTGYATLYTYDTATKFQNKLNDGLTAVNEIINAHRGYLSTSQWAELVVALDGNSIAANDWVVTSGKPSHKMHPLDKVCYCKPCQKSHHSYDAKGSCVYCGTYEAPTGTGSKKDPYKIGNLGQLYSYASNVKRANNNGYGELIADIVVNENLLKEDGTLNGNPEDFLVWTPMGTKEKPFSWAFNGNGHTITGLYVDGDTQYVGFFGFISKDQVYIENLGIVDSYFAGDRYVGAVAGGSENCGFRNCYSENCVIKGDMLVGGITSTAYWNVQNCYSSSTLIANKYVGGISYTGSRYFMDKCLFVGQIICEKETFAINDSNSYVRNCYYLDSCGANGTTSGKDFAVTAQQLASGEIAYKLGEAYGQNIDNGQPKQPYPILGGAKVYEIQGCDGSSPAGYTNIEGVSGGHSGDYGENGICPRCDAYEPANLVDGYYQIANAGNFYWFAEKVNKGGEAERTLNAILLNDIDLEGKADGSGRKWTPIGTTGGTNSQSFRGIFDGNGKTITGLYVDVQKSGLGLFGEVRDGTVKNFTVYGEVKLTGKHDYIGGVIGSACGTGDGMGSVVSGITSYVNVTLGAGTHGSNRVAGLIGYVNHDTLVENCVWYGTLDLDIYRAQDGVGGLIGKAHDQFTGTIRNCAAYGTIRTAYSSGSYINPSNSVPFTTIYIGGLLSNSVAGATTVLENCVWGGTFINETDLDDDAHISAVGTMNGFSSITSCYVLNNASYITTNNAQDQYFTLITRDQLISGEIAYTLSKTEKGSTWGQTIDGEGLPVPVGEKVYYGYLSCTDTEMSYANDSTVDEAKDNHTQEPSYRDNGDGTHTQSYLCCGTEFTDIRHSFNKNICVCGAFGDHWNETCYWTLKDGVMMFHGSGAINEPVSEWSDYNWWNFHDEITTLVIGEGITYIGANAFLGCESLNSVTLPDSLLTMGAGVFSSCESLESIQLPKNLKYLPKSVFLDSALKSITIPASVEYIGEAAFSNCTSLTEVILPEGLERIERSAFSWSPSLAQIDIPASVTFIGDQAFMGSRTKVNMAADNPNYSSDADGALYNKDKTILYHCPVTADVYIAAATVTELAPYAFCETLSNSIILPEGLKIIGENAFWLAQMHHISIPSTVEEIRTDAFYTTGYLKNVDVVCSWNDLYTFDDSVTVNKVIHAQFDAETGLCTVCSTHKPDAEAVVSFAGVNAGAYDTLEEAFEAVSSAEAEDEAVVTLWKDSDLDSSIAAPDSGVFILDLNGYDVNVDAETLTVMDSSATESTAGTGSLITNAVVTQDHTANGMRYITLLEDNVYTFHCVTFKLSQISLRPSAAGLYYTATLLCDSVLSEYISCYGVALSVNRMPGADFATASDVSYTCIQGAPGENNMTSGLVQNIFRKDASNNAARGKIQIYANAYFKLGSGAVIMAHDNTKQSVSRSLYDVLAALDAKYMQMNAATQDALNDFAYLWKDVITEYGLENLLDDHIPEAP